MRQDNNLLIDMLAKKISILENALQQVIEMQSMFYMEIENLKKNSNSNQSQANSETVQVPQEQQDANSDELDIEAVRKILAEQKLQQNQTQTSNNIFKSNLGQRM